MLNKVLFALMVFQLGFAPARTSADVVPFPRPSRTAGGASNVLSCETRLSLRLLNERIVQLALNAGVDRGSALRLSERLTIIKDYELLARLVLLVQSNLSRTDAIIDDDLHMMIQTYIQEDLENLHGHNLKRTLNSQTSLARYFEVEVTSDENAEEIFLLFADRRAASEDASHSFSLDLKLNQILISVELVNRSFVQDELLKLSHELSDSYDTYWSHDRERERYLERVSLAYKIVFVWNQLSFLNDIVENYNLGDASKTPFMNELLLKNIVYRFLNFPDQISSIDKLLTEAMNAFFDDFVRIHQISWTEPNLSGDLLTFLRKTFEKVERRSDVWLRMEITR